jgi:hypothetical protein
MPYWQALGSLCRVKLETNLYLFCSDLSYVHCAGICYVGFSNIYTRVLFLLLPYFIFIAMAGFFRSTYFASDYLFSYFLP